MGPKGNYTITGRDYRKELLPVALDNIARDRPEETFALIARDEQLAGGFQTVTFRKLATAADRASWWLEEMLGKQADFPTLTYIGVGDIRYYCLLLGCIKVGYKVRAFVRGEDGRRD